MNSPAKARVRLADEQRDELERLARDGRTPARKARYARLLLHADEAHPEGQRSDLWIAQALGMHPNTVARVREDFVDAGIDVAFAQAPLDAPGRAQDRRSGRGPPRGHALRRPLRAAPLDAGTPGRRADGPQAGHPRLHRDGAQGAKKLS